MPTEKPKSTVRIVSITPDGAKLPRLSIGNEFLCKAQGNPDPTITWKRGAKDTFYSFSMCNFSLIIYI